jgi:hypothetical protein
MSAIYVAERVGDGEDVRALQPEDGIHPLGQQGLNHGLASVLLFHRSRFHLN